MALEYCIFIIVWVVRKAVAIHVHLLVASPSKVLEVEVVGSGVDVGSVDNVFNGIGVSVWALLVLMLIRKAPKSWRQRGEATAVILK